MNHEINSTKEFEEVRSHMARAREQMEDELKSLEAKAGELKIKVDASSTDPEDLVRYRETSDKIVALKDQMSIGRIYPIAKSSWKLFWLGSTGSS